MTDLLCPSGKLSLKASSKSWIDSETISAIPKRDKLSKKYKNSGLETEKDYFQSAAKALQKITSKKEKSYFQVKLKRMLIILRNYGKQALKSLEMKNQVK